MEQIDDGILFPVLGIFGIGAEAFGNVPAIREWAYIHPAGHTSGSTPDILMPKGQVKRAMSSHTQTGYGSFGPVGNGPVMRINPGYQLAGNISLVFHGRINRAVEVPTGSTAIGADNDEIVFVRVIGERCVSEPFRIIVSGAMQQIE